MLELRVIDDMDKRVQKESVIADDTTEFTFLGLFPGKENFIELKFIRGNGDYALDTVSVTTDPLPEFMPDVSIVTPGSDNIEPGWNLCNFSIRENNTHHSYPYAFVKYGNVRWYMDVNFYNNFVFPIELTPDKTLLFGYGNYIWEADLSGEIVKEIHLPEVGNIHHDIIKLDNGNYIVSVAMGGTVIDSSGNTIETMDDNVIEVDQSGAILTTWDLREILDIDRYDIVQNPQDWFHMNAIAYDASDHSLIISGRHQGVIKVDWNNNLKWIMSPHRGWGKSGRDGTGPDTKPYLLTAVDGAANPYNENVQSGTENISEFEWPWGQHDPELLPNGNIIIFDNGTNRNFGMFDQNTNYSRMVEYKIDEENMTIHQVWSYGRERGNELFSPIVSAVSYLPETQNYLFVPGVLNNFNEAGIIEIEPATKQVVFEARMLIKHLYGSNDWGNFDLTYRITRVKI
ncbi:MAG: aryl-sulfate sulfotransferase [Bacteroidota bacterium]